ncbi:MAG: hypothetical protein AB7N76_07850 [Planctomycetota bacterium]
MALARDLGLAEDAELLVADALRRAEEGGCAGEEGLSAEPVAIRTRMALD